MGLVIGSSTIYLALYPWRLSHLGPLPSSRVSQGGGRAGRQDQVKRRSEKSGVSPLLFLPASSKPGPQLH